MSIKPPATPAWVHPPIVSLVDVVDNIMKFASPLYSKFPIITKTGLLKLDDCDIVNDCQRLPWYLTRQPG